MPAVAVEQERRHGLARRRPARLGQRQQGARDALGPEAEKQSEVRAIAGRADDRRPRVRCRA